MTRLHRVPGFLLAVVAIVVGIDREVRAQTASTNARPNIVMIVSDDHGWTDYGFMGHPDVRTPHLDRLASRSAVFRRGYVPTALCRPSLMTMITGLYPHQHGVTGNDPARSTELSADEYARQRERLIAKVEQLDTLPKILGPLGYRSHQSGKWWEGNFRRGGFTHGMTRGFPQPGGRHGDDGLEIGRQGMQPVFDFIDESTTANKPFFLWYAPLLPHTPHTPPERLLKKYTTGDRPIELAKYYAMIEWFDETCGELTGYLDQQKLTQNTIIVYVADNGWIQPTPQMNLGDWKQPFAPKSKQSPYDGGTRTPIMFSWPGVISPAMRSELASSIDIVPTLLAALRLPARDRLPGLDLLPSLTGNSAITRQTLYGESFSHDLADLDKPEASLLYRWMIDGNWKVLLSYEAPRDRYTNAHQAYVKTPQLFDLEADPHENTNLAGKNPEVVATLAKRIQEFWTVTKPAIAAGAK